MDIFERSEIEDKIYKPATDQEVENGALEGDRYKVERDDVHDLMANMSFIRNQLLQEILEYYGIELDDVDDRGIQDPLEEKIDEDPNNSISYKNEAFVEEEKDYAINKMGVTSNLFILSDNKSVGDLMCDWWKNGKMIDKSKLGNIPGFDGTLDPSFGGFIGNVEGWDVNRSIEGLVRRSLSSTSRQCAKYVRMAIEDGGISTAGRPENAKDYVHFLPKIGFKFYGTVIGDKAYGDYMRDKVMPGDIAVYAKPGNPGAAGHICMYSGKQWISDFRQPRAWVYGYLTGGKTGQMYIFRFANITEGMKMGNLDLAPGQSGISQEMFNIIARFETGHDYGATLSYKETHGYGHDQGHKTYAYGLLRHSNGQFMDQIKSVWTQQELEGLYVVRAKQFSDAVRKWAKSHGLSLAQNQIDALTSAAFNFGEGFLTMSRYKVCQLIASHASPQTIFTTWSTLSDNRSLAGLKKRRRFEANWYMGKKTSPW